MGTLIVVMLVVSAFLAVIYLKRCLKPVVAQVAAPIAGGSSGRKVCYTSPAGDMMGGHVPSFPPGGGRRALFIPDEGRSFRARLARLSEF